MRPNKTISGIRERRVRANDAHTNDGIGLISEDSVGRFILVPTVRQLVWQQTNESVSEAVGPVRLTAGFRDSCIDTVSTRLLTSVAQTDPTTVSDSTTGGEHGAS